MVEVKLKLRQVEKTYNDEASSPKEDYGHAPCTIVFLLGTSVY